MSLIYKKGGTRRTIWLAYLAVMLPQNAPGAG